MTAVVGLLSPPEPSRLPARAALSILESLGAPEANAVAGHNRAPAGDDIVLSTLEDTPAIGRVVALDPDGDVLVYRLATPPLHGSVYIDETSALFAYTPAANHHGTDRFAVSIADDHFGSDTATVSISVTEVNDRPVATDHSPSINADALLVGAVTATDVDADPLAYSVSLLPAHGTTMVTASGNFSYTPAANYHGSDRFAVVVRDGRGGFDTATFSVTVVPVADPARRSACAAAEGGRESDSPAAITRTGDARPT